MSDLTLPPLSFDAPGETVPSRKAKPGQGAALPRAPFLWPTPPLAAYPQPTPALEPEACEIEVRAGHLVAGLLVDFDPEEGQARVQLPTERAPMLLRFNQIRRLTLKRSLAPLSAAMVADAHDEATGQVLGHRDSLPYEITLQDGGRLVGRTVGHVDTPAGLFLFMPVDALGSVQRSFVPRAAIARQQVGEPLGQVLIEQQATTAAQLEAALQQQQALRNRKLGEQLVEQQLVTSEQLLAALDQQARMPTVRLGEALVALGFIDEATLQRALDQQRAERSQPLGALLLQRGLVDLPQLRIALARKLGYPVVDVGRFPVEADALRVLTLNAARRLQALPLMRRGGRLAVALTDTSQHEVVAELERLTQCHVAPVLAGSGSLGHAIDRAYGLGGDGIDFHPEPDFLGAALRKSPTPEAVGGRPMVLQDHAPAVERAAAALAEPASETPTLDLLLDDLHAAAPPIPALTAPPPAPVPAPGATTAAASAPVSWPTLPVASQLVELDLPEEAATGVAADGLSAGRAPAAIEPLVLETMPAVPAASAVPAPAPVAAPLPSPPAPAQAATPVAVEPAAAAPRQEPPLLQTLANLVVDALNRGASSVQIEALGPEDKLQVRLRRNGRLEPHSELPGALRAPLLARIKALADLDTSETRKPQEGRLPFLRLVPQQPIDLRVLTLPTHDGLEDVVLGLPARLKPYALDAIGLPAGELERLKALLERPAGLILCVGPARSGRTTALHAMLGQLIKPHRRIWTVEERIELTQPGLRQMEVRTDEGQSLERALQSLLTVDADVLMVGQITDAATARLAVEAALRGRLVLAGMTARSAGDGVMRLIDQGVPAWDLADALLGVHSQRLLRRLCNACRMSRSAKEGEVEDWLDGYFHGGIVEDAQADREALLRGWTERHGRDGRLRRYHSPGCERCGHTGVRGRVAVHELMPVSRELRRLMRAGAPAWNLQRQAAKEGQRSLRQDALEKMIAGQVSLDEVRSLVEL